MCLREIFSPRCFILALLCLLHSSAWLTGYDDPMIDKINDRIEDLTGLEMDTAEELQVKTLDVRPL